VKLAAPFGVLNLYTAQCTPVFTLEMFLYTLYSLTYTRFSSLAFSGFSEQINVFSEYSLYTSHVFHETVVLAAGPAPACLDMLGKVPLQKRLVDKLHPVGIMTLVRGKDRDA
jgi:hypothetical protein